MRYRCLHSPGFQVALFNVEIESNFLICGLGFFTAGVGDRITLTDVDSGIKICVVAPPEELKNCQTFMFLADVLDKISLQIYEILALPSHSSF